MLAQICSLKKNPGLQSAPKVRRPFFHAAEKRLHGHPAVTGLSLMLKQDFWQAKNEDVCRDWCGMIKRYQVPGSLL